jgi:hypothetical protein
VDPTTGASANFANIISSAVIEGLDGLALDPSGNYLFVAGRTGVFPNDSGFLAVVSRQTGAVVQQLDASHFPDGIAFAADSSYLVTNNNDGNITRYDFPSRDFTQIPTVTVIADGGFRGDLAKVGPDGCFYVTQAGTRFADGTVTSDNSIVKICAQGTAAFAKPPGTCSRVPIPLPAPATSPLNFCHFNSLVPPGVIGPQAGNAVQVQSINTHIAPGALQLVNNRWQILQNIQTLIFEIQQDITVNKAHTPDKAQTKGWVQFVPAPVVQSFHIEIRWGQRPIFAGPVSFTIAVGNNSGSVVVTPP